VEKPKGKDSEEKKEDKKDTIEKGKKPGSKGKPGSDAKKNEALNQQSSVNKKECLGWQTECLREQGIYNFR
jgi:hypothetical protein